ncbi:MULTISPECIES: HigA family addiction module antitoxin [Kocuria]|uniref:HigA family addiction module antidote protein n=1 Tax=Kocuria subflava TaxID=1736139 RepID=A0A846TLH4_9MICC|nr:MULTISPECIES: HigA family addiction module antitoxin [Kocuria]NKE09293.1 HigA family addiction module antidote protein [Kocuria subflava]
MNNKLYAPIHPGEVLLEDFLKGSAMTPDELANSIGISPRWINELVQGKRAITAVTARILGQHYAVESQFWLNLQSRYELEIAEDLAAYEMVENNLLQCDF